ncbi:MAG: hypothetical protein J2P47_13825, partial [Acetobacteraceae bacterium]|nr:hypothetical protein [Acetobacteraceae bacterium]
MLSETDRAEWARYVRLVAPLPGRVRPEPPTALQRSPPLVAPRTARLPAMGSSIASALVVGAQPPGVDNATWQRFRTGRL